MTPRTLSFALAATAALVGSVARADAKLAYVDEMRALGEIEEGKAAKAKLKRQFDDKQKELDAKQEELKREDANLKSMAREGVIKEDKLREKSAELEKKLMEVTKYWQDSQKALSDEERRLTQEIQSKMQVVIRGIAEADGIAFVFDKNALAYGPDALDITNELIRKYNAKYGAGKQGAAPAPSPAAKPAPAATPNANKK